MTSHQPGGKESSPGPQTETERRSHQRREKDPTPTAGATGEGPGPGAAQWGRGHAPGSVTLSFCNVQHTVTSIRTDVVVCVLLVSSLRRSAHRRSRRSRSRSASRNRRRLTYSQRDRWKREPSHSPVLILRKKRSPTRKDRSRSASPKRISELGQIR